MTANTGTFGQELTTERVASGFAIPVLVTAPTDDPDRIFIVEQGGLIRIADRSGNGVYPDPFLDISDRVRSGGERGLLGLAFHPDYDNTGYLFVNYTNSSGATTVARFSVSANNPDLADPASEKILLTVSQPYSNHNGGNIVFGPDGYLYIGMGDGGSGNDPGNRAQNPLEFLGKILRIDVDNGDPYGIPADNPFVNDPGTLDEIWAIGVRNPWRWSFDRETGDLWIGDVGQSAREELDFQPADSPGGENYGWRCMEGFRCTGLDGCNCNGPELTLPIYDYTHAGGRCSVTGGYVYRGPSIPLLAGTYFFADYCAADIWSFRYDGSQMSEFTDRTVELDPGNGQAIDFIPSFGEDGLGELYIVDIEGEVYRLKTTLELETNTLTAGQNGIFRARGAAANTMVYFVYSLTGTGRTTVPPLGVDLALASPQLVGQKQADASGTAVLVKLVPGIAQGKTVWLQAAVDGNSSNVITTVID
ncbi:MAG: glucose dehydrogenase [Planctomycetes bacterium]|nr:glucose dehydrogenase [Planctomycetota bacterium]NOG55364.1 glucose dehydrogenase [Planctomycetota bacterium]